MKKITYLFLLAAALGACTPKPSNKVETIQPAAPSSIFPKGNVIEGTNFNGTAYLQRLMTDSETFDVVVSDVIFEPKARNSWHSHPGGQILIATAGKGYYQEKGKPIQVLNPGDVVYSGRCGALARSGFRQRIHAYSNQYKGSFGCYPVVCSRNRRRVQQ